jgi:hypothetical protein
MKKGVFIFVLALIVCGMTFAQTAPTTSAVSGTRGLSYGRIILKSGDTSYYTRGLERFIGFIDGLKEGAQVTIEGYVLPPRLEGADERFLFPIKLTINDKTYEVGPVFADAGTRRHSRGPGRGLGRSPGRSPGRMGRGDHCRRGRW